MNRIYSYSYYLNTFKKYIIIISEINNIQKKGYPFVVLQD